MLKPTESADVYAQFPDTDNYGNVVPTDFTVLIPNMPLNIHRGAQGAKNDAAAAGWDTNLAALAYSAVSYGDTLRAGMVLITPTEYWRIMDPPNVRNRFPQTAHVRMVLKLLFTQPAGVPDLTGT